MAAKGSVASIEFLIDQVPIENIRWKFFFFAWDGEPFSMLLYQT